MASTSTVSLIDRADVHKSCKAMETIMAVLVTYTETATALANIQKKLAKALREAAGVKSTNNVPANVLTASAVVFEALSEVDTKFSKIVDKEGENIGNEVKKWFKKLAKEEKTHDERMAAANAKIKQAGQAYEKMAKRKDRDVTEEHSRYVAILNTLGPEMQQDKHKHALFVTQRHTAALSEFAAALARLAEAEWFRACEQVRKFAPSIGNLGEWRVLCEGSWSGPTPSDLPDIDKFNADTEKKPHTEQTIPRRPSPNASEYSESLSNSVTSRLPYLSETLTETRDVHLAPPPLSITAQDIPRQPVRQRSLNVDASSDMITSLLPSKPTSPMEPSIPEEEVNEAGPSYQPQERFNLNAGEAKATPRPLPLSEEPAAAPPVDGISSAIDNSSPERTTRANDKPAPVPQGQQEEARELVKSPESAKSPDVDRPDHASSALGESSTNRRNSLVATMRERYDSRPDPTPPQSPTPPFRDILRSSPKVTDLATRYAYLDSPASSSRGTSLNSSVQSNAASSSADYKFTTFQERRHNRLAGLPPNSNVGEGGGRGPQRDYFDEHEEQPRYSAATTPVRGGQPYSHRDWDDYIPPPRRREPFQERGYTQHEYDEMGARRQADPLDEQIFSLEEKEAHLREQARQIERERARLADERQRERQRDERESGYASDTHIPSSYNGRRVYTASPQPISVNSEVSLLRPLPVPADHAPNCGCQRCSAQHYRSPAGALSSPTLAGSSNSVNTAGNRDRDGAVVFKPDPPIQLRPEKPKGWFRRMSMPVAGIVGNDREKKGQSPGVPPVNDTRVHMAVPEEDGRVRRRSFEGDDAIRPGVAGLGAGGGTGRYAYGGTTGRRY